MIGLSLDRYRRGGRLILCKHDIEHITETIIGDFKPQALKEPMALSADEFIEQYLGYNIRYEYLTNNQSILGMVTFGGGKMTVFDLENENIQDIYLKENTVLIDSTLLDEDKVGRYEFTGFHESGHCVLHVPVTDGSVPIDFINCANMETIICRPNNSLERSGFSKTQEDWMEWQADYFSACMKMPRRQVREVAIEALRSIGIMKDSVSIYENDKYNECSEYLPCLISELFTTSKTAARYRLQELKILNSNNDVFDSVNGHQKGVG